MLSRSILLHDDEEKHSVSASSSCSVPSPVVLNGYCIICHIDEELVFAMSNDGIVNYVFFDDKYKAFHSVDIVRSIHIHDKAIQEQSHVDLKTIILDYLVLSVFESSQLKHEITSFNSLLFHVDNKMSKCGVIYRSFDNTMCWYFPFLTLRVFSKLGVAEPNKIGISSCFAYITAKSLA